MTARHPTGLVAALRDTDPAKPCFDRDGQPVTAGDICDAAATTARRMADAGPVLFLHTDSAALFAAGLLAGAALQRTVAILPHAQPDYLAEVGAAAHNLMTDRGDDATLAFASGADTSLLANATRDLPLVFYTSGSTGAPKPTPKRLSQIETEAAAWIGRLDGRIAHVAGTVSHQHIYGCIFRVALPVIAGWVSSDQQAFAWEAFAAQLGPLTLGVTSPPHLTRIPPGLKVEPGAPALMLSSGQALPLQGARDAAALFGAPPLEILGSTETGGVATRQRTDDAEPWTPLTEASIQLDAEGALLVTSPQSGGDAPVALGDRAELLGDGRFRLLARADRIVKIEAKRVSLTRVEAALLALPDIDDAAAFQLGGEGGPLAAVVQLAEPGRRELGLTGAFRFSRELRRRLAETLEPAERPKRWRFVGRLPANAQGKRTLSSLSALFDGAPLRTELGIHRETVSAESAELEFDLSPDLDWFEGHFPDEPILAGVVQAHLAVRLGEEIWGYLPNSFSTSRLKFRRLIFGGDRVRLRLQRHPEEGRLAFAFAANGSPASEGIVGR